MSAAALSTGGSLEDAERKSSPEPAAAAPAKDYSWIWWVVVIGLICICNYKPSIEPEHQRTTVDQRLSHISDAELVSPGSTVAARTPTTSAPGSSDGVVVSPQVGDSSHHGGSPTVRRSFQRGADDPSTTNDESNDQPLGHFGSRTISVTYANSGNTYDVDADVEDGEVKRLYFAKGGWVDFDASDIDADGNGTGTDEQGREWEFNGFR